MDKLRIILLKIIINVRWAYFHISPMYIKFYMTADEPWFQHRKLGTIHCNYKVLQEKQGDDNE